MHLHIVSAKGKNGHSKTSAAPQREVSNNELATKLDELIDKVDDMRIELKAERKAGIAARTRILKIEEHIGLRKKKR